MMCYLDTAETKLLLNGNDNWENQLKDLKETFNDFYLISFKIKEINTIRYNVFVFTHEVKINSNYSFD